MGSGQRGQVITRYKPGNTELGMDKELTRVYRSIRIRIQRPLGHFAVGLLATVFLALAYAVIFTYITLVKYMTFHDTWFDLGLNNEIFWLMTHGGYPAYIASGWGAVHSFPFQRLSMLVLLPVYWVSPSPSTLLVMQAIMLGGAAIPLYLLTYYKFKSATGSLLVAAAYLCNIMIQSANMYDFHLVTLFPLVFFSLVASWLWGRYSTFAAFGVIGSLINPLASLTLVALLLYFVLGEVRSTCVPRFESNSLSGGGPSPACRLLTFFHRTRAPVALGTFIVIANLVALAASLRYSGPQSSGFGGFRFQLSSLYVQSNTKLTLSFFLLAPFCVFFLLDIPYTVVLMPFFLYIAFLVTPYPVNSFYGSWPVMAIPAIAVGAVFGIAKVSSGSRPWILESSRLGIGSQSNRHRKFTLAHQTRRGTRLAWVALSVALCFALVYSPLGPLNGDVQGGLFQGAYELPSLLEYSRSTVFLSKAINLVPSSAAVLTQNDIPQLSGRVHVMVAGFPIPNFYYNYIVADSELNFFTSFSDILPYLQLALANGTFGILAEGYGVIVLERGFHSRPVLFSPFTQYIPASGFLTFPPANLSGGIVIHQPSNGFSQYVWYGPYEPLDPGSYNATFRVLAQTSNFTMHDLVTLDVIYGLNSTVLASTPLTATDLAPLGVWHNVTLSFNIPTYVEGVQFRGINASADATIEFSGLQVDQVPA